MLRFRALFFPEYLPRRGRSPIVESTRRANLEQVAYAASLPGRRRAHPRVAPNILERLYEGASARSQPIGCQRIGTREADNLHSRLCDASRARSHTYQTGTCWNCWSGSGRGPAARLPWTGVAMSSRPIYRTPSKWRRRPRTSVIPPRVGPVRAEEMHSRRTTRTNNATQFSNFCNLPNHSHEGKGVVDRRGCYTCRNTGPLWRNRHKARIVSLVATTDENNKGKAPSLVMRTKVRGKDVSLSIDSESMKHAGSTIIARSMTIR